LCTLKMGCMCCMRYLARCLQPVHYNTDSNMITQRVSSMPLVKVTSEHNAVLGGDCVHFWEQLADTPAATAPAVACKHVSLYPGWSCCLPWMELLLKCSMRQESCRRTHACRACYVGVITDIAQLVDHQHFRVARRMNNGWRVGGCD
jgi:hypothetical protein